MERLRSFEDGLESVIAEGTDEDNEVIRAREMLNNLSSIRASATSQQEQQQQQQNSTLPPTESVIVPSTVREDIEEALLSRTLSRDVSQENEADNTVGSDEKKLKSVGVEHSSMRTESVGVYSWGQSDIGTLMRPSPVYDLADPIPLARIPRSLQINTIQQHVLRQRIIHSGLNISGQVCEQQKVSTATNAK